MRNALAALLCAALVLAAGCGGAASEQPEPSYLLYYRETNLDDAAGSDALRAESTALEGVDPADTQAMVMALMARWMEGPTDVTLKAAIPSGVQLLSATVERGRAVVDLSAAYGSLSGVNLTLADYAITLTLSQLPEILAVRVTVRGQELAYRDRQVFSAADVHLSHKGDVVSAVTATLYYPNERGTLLGVRRVLDLYEGDTQVDAVARALEDGPEKEGLFDVMPEGFRVRSVWLEEDICYVNLSSVQLKNMPSLEGLPTAMDALQRSLCSLESVSEVRFLVDGEYARFYGPVKIEEPYTE